MRKILFFLTLTAAAVLAGCQEKSETEAVPELRLGFTGDFILAPEGGDTSFVYTLESPAADGKLKVSVPESETWLGEFEVADNSTVTFTVEPNETDAERSAEITLTYTYGESGIIECGFMAVQSPVPAGPDDPDDPDEPWTGPVPDVIMVDMSVPAEGGLYKLLYYIAEPVPGAKLYMTCSDAWWVSDVVCDTVNSEISFRVAPNDGERRTFSITLTYVYGPGQETSATAEIAQSASASEGPDYEWDMVKMMGEYMGNKKTYTDVHVYYTYMSNITFDAPDDYLSGSCSYDVEIYGPEPLDPDILLPVEGTYEYGTTYMMNTFNITYRDAFGDWYYFNSGTMTLGYDEEGNMLMDILATDEDGMIHHVTYAGPANYVDIREE